MKAKNVIGAWAVLLMFAVLIAMPASAVTALDEEDNTDLIVAYDIEEVGPYMILANQTLEEFENSTGIDGLDDNETILMTVYHRDGSSFTHDLRVDDDDVVIDNYTWNFTEIGWEQKAWSDDTDDDFFFGKPVYLEYDGDDYEVMPISPTADDNPIYMIPVTGSIEIGGVVIDLVAPKAEFDATRNITGDEDEIEVTADTYVLYIDDEEEYIFPWEAYAIDDEDWDDTDELMFQVGNMTDDGVPVVFVYNLDLEKADDVAGKFHAPGSHSWYAFWDWAPAQSYEAREFGDETTLFSTEDDDTWFAVATETGWVKDYEVFYSPDEGFYVERGGFNWMGAKPTGDYTDEEAFSLQNVDFIVMKSLTVDDDETSEEIVGVLVDNTATFSAKAYWGLYGAKDHPVTVAGI